MKHGSSNKVFIREIRSFAYHYGFIGKSNIMDAISFVLGLKSNALRSSQLKELIYRSGQLEEFEPSQVQPEYVTNDCSVALLYETNTGTEIEFSRA